MSAQARQTQVQKQPEPQLGVSSGGNFGGGGKAAAAASGPPRDPTLKDKFNKAASGVTLGRPGGPKISTQAKIDMLTRKMSQPRMNCSYSPLGTVTNSINRSFDHPAAKEITRLKASEKARLQAQQAQKSASLSQKFKQAKQPTLTREFNQASLGRKF